MKKVYIFLILLVSILFTINSCTKDEEDPVMLKLDKSEYVLEVGEKVTINVVQAPNTGDVLVWSSDDESVASVFMGIVTANASGIATITATYGNQTQTCVITIPVREYQLVWAEEFDGDELNLNDWTYEVNGSGGGNGEQQYYTDRTENLRVSDGILTIEARKEDYLGKEYTSARIVTKDKVDFKYGKVETRLKVPKGIGTWPAFWMLGYGSWPSAGEIDIMEHVGYDPLKFHCALHTSNLNGMNGRNPHASKTFDEDVANDFHTITMDWIENEFQGYDRIHIYIDGVKIKTFAETAQLQDSGDWPFNDDFFFIINLAIGGSWGGSQGIDDTMFDIPVLYQVDYIRVYQLQ